MNKATGIKLILFYPLLLFSMDLNGTVETGVAIILHDNGKWEYDTSRAIIDSGSADKGSSFRGIQWGQNKSQIRKIEKATVDEEASDDDALVYKVRVGGLNAFLIYCFSNDKLYRANYVINEGHSNLNLYIDDYNSIRSLINKAHGKPKTDTRQWIDSLYKKDCSNWGTAISIGHLKNYAIWENASNIVLLYLDGSRYKIRMGVQYLSKALREEAKKNNENNANKDF